MRHGSVQLLESAEFVGIVESAFPDAEGLRDFEAEPGGFFDVRLAAPARAAAGNGPDPGDRDAYDGNVRGGTGLKDAVDVKDAVSVGRNVLGRDGEDLGIEGRRPLHDIQKVVTHLEDETLP